MSVTEVEKPVRPEVRRGMKLLDEVRPGWRKRIDLDTLYLGHSAHCILGQVYGDYFEGKWSLGLGVQEAMHFGFLAGDEWALTEEWRRALAA